jgi:hypothetical protein
MQRFDKSVFDKEAHPSETPEASSSVVIASASSHSQALVVVLAPLASGTRLCSKVSDTQMRTSPRELTAQVVQPVKPEPPHCPYFATVQPPPPEELVVVAAAEDLDVEVAEVWRVVLTSPPEPGV